MIEKSDNCLVKEKIFVTLQQKREYLFSINLNFLHYERRIQDWNGYRRDDES